MTLRDEIDFFDISLTSFRSAANTFTTSTMESFEMIVNGERQLTVVTNIEITAKNEWQRQLVDF